jgi:hypothetical protein
LTRVRAAGLGALFNLVDDLGEVISESGKLNAELITSFLELVQLRPRRLPLCGGGALGRLAGLVCLSSGLLDGGGRLSLGGCPDRGGLVAGGTKDLGRLLASGTAGLSGFPFGQAQHVLDAAAKADLSILGRLRELYLGGLRTPHRGAKLVGQLFHRLIYLVSVIAAQDDVEHLYPPLIR